MKQILTVNNIRIPITVDEKYAVRKAREKLKLSPSDITFAKISKRSVDARRRNGKDIEFVCSVRIECEITQGTLDRLKHNPDVHISDVAVLECEYGNEQLTSRPLVVGFGPCGMFSALILAENGYKPVVIERGADVEKRKAAVDFFIKTGILDTETNIQFGAGGAGTFSDGKLVTRINDPKCNYVLERFAGFGAPEEILYLAKPHIGTDRLLGVVAGIRDRVTELGGEICFDTKLYQINSDGGKVTSVILEKNGIKENFPCGAVILATGHSARDTYEMLAQKGIELLPKPFSVGVRVEHLQKDIDSAMYGDAAEYAGDILPHAEYSLSFRENPNGRGVYSFCMCPGGEVIASASEAGGVVTNGMSRYARDGINANAAIAVSVFPKDCGTGWKDGILFQRMLEKKAYDIADSGRHDYYAPCETLGDFLDGKTGNFTLPSRVQPTYRNGSCTLCDLSRILPDFVTGTLKKGFANFGKKIKGFDAGSAVLTGVETRTSSPVRIPRNENGVCAAFDNLYPCGEGAGYAGGITSAAVDGINIALLLMKKYSNNNL